MTTGEARYRIRRPLLLWFGFFALGVLWLAPGLGGGHFADDFQFVFEEPCRTIGSHFFEPNPQNRFYRPLQVAYSASVQCATGTNTLPLHLMQIALHALLAVLVTVAALRLKFLRTAAVIAGLFFLLGHANVSAVLGNDTMSQLAGAVFGFGAVLMVWMVLSQSSRRFFLWMTMAAVLLFISLLWKETSAGYYLVMIALPAVLPYRPDEKPGRSHRIAAATLFTVAFAAYVTLRTAVMGDLPGAGETRYDFSGGFNVPANLMHFGFAALSPVSTVWIAQAWWQQDALQLGLLLLPALLVFAALTRAVSLRSGVKVPLAILALGALSLFPAIILNHVSELYLYNAMPFAALLLGLAYHECASRRPKFARYFLIFVGLVLAGNLVSSWHKSSLMQRNGDRAEALLSQIVPHVASAEPGGTVALVNTRPELFRYSIFVMPEFDVIARGSHRAPQRAGRPDVTVTFMPGPGPDVIDPRIHYLIVDERDEISTLHAASE